MKNFEAYESKIKELRTNTALIKNNELVPCTSVSCGECKFYDKDSDCTTKMFEWLYEEYKEPPIKLSQLEFELLKYYQKNDYKYITRDETNNRLSFFREKPKRIFCSWLSNEFFEVHYPVFRKYLTELFLFIKWEDEEPYSITYILNNCEVDEMRKLRVTCPVDKLTFMQVGDIITDYEVIWDNFNPPLIKVNTSNYAKDNKFEENGRFMWWASESFWIGFNNIEVIK